MKRRDWKIKKSKKNIYGKFFKRRRIFFLRKLFLRKHLVLVKKNLIQHYLYYNFYLKNMKILKKNLIKKTNFNYNYNYNITLPVFFFRPKVFGFFNNFKDLITKFNLSYFFLNSFEKKNLSINFGNNLIFFNQDLLFKNINFEDSKNIISFKKKYLPIYSNNNFNNNFSFNLYIINSVEIYKIVILLYLNLLKITNK